MTEVNNISVEQAAILYSDRSLPNHVIDQRPLKESLNYAFQAGAQWQKEQDNALKEAAERALNYLSVKYPKEAEILHELKKAIENYNH